MTLHTANKEDTEEILKVLGGAFKIKKAGKKWRDHQKAVSQEPQNWRVLLLNKQIIGVVHIGKDKLRIGKSTILKGDVGEVSVLPEYQGKSYGIELMRDTVAWMRRERYDISRLGGLVKFYSKSGWIRFPRRYVEFSIGKGEKAGALIVQPSELPILEKYQSKIEPFNSEKDHSQYIELYEEFNQPYNGSLVHTIKDETTPPRQSSDSLRFVFREMGKIVGYLFAIQYEKDYTEFEARITISDISYERDKPYVFASLIKHILNFAYRKKISRVTARVPFDPEILEILSQIPVQFQCIETYGGKASNMLQIITLQSLFEKLIPELEDRLKNSVASNWQGTLEIKIEKDKVQLYINKRKIKVIEGKKPDLQLFVKEVYLLKLILGLFSFAEVQNILDKRIELNPSKAALLRGLFPRKMVASNNWG